MIWCIVPFTREHLMGSVVANVARQTVADSRLLIVRDGEGQTRVNGSVTELYSGELGIAAALNAGLAYARVHGRHGDQFAKFDDDDWYGPRYLERVPPGYSACGSWWVRTEEGRFWFVEPERGLHGSTLAGPLDGPEFPHVDRWGEDTRWIAAVGRERFARRPAGHYCYQRCGHDHAWPVPTAAIPSPAFPRVIDCGTEGGVLFDDDPPSGSVTVAQLPIAARVAACRAGAVRALTRATG